MAKLYYAEHVHIAKTQTQILTSYFGIGQESESESILESVSGNVNKPLGYLYLWPFSSAIISSLTKQVRVYEHLPLRERLVAASAG